MAERICVSNGMVSFVFSVYVFVFIFLAWEKLIMLNGEPIKIKDRYYIWKAEKQQGYGVTVYKEVDRDENDLHLEKVDFFWFPNKEKMVSYFRKVTQGY